MSKLKMVIALLLVGMLAFASPASAVSANRIRSTTGIEASEAAVLPAGTWVYGLSIYADAASSQVAIFDAATTATTTASAAIDEIGEATQYDTETHWYPEPIYFENGVSVWITTGVAVIFYGPPPSN